ILVSNKTEQDFAGMRKLAFHFIFLGVAALAAAPAFGQAKPASKAPAPILPAKLGSWSATGGVPAATSSLPAEVARETGHSAESKSYSSGNKAVAVEVQRYADPSAAYEGYTAQLAIGMLPGDLKVASAVDRDRGRMLILVGNLVGDVRKPGDLSNGD